MKPHRGTLILILGILGLIMCGIFTAIPAWIMGKGDLKEMDAGRMDPAGRDLTKIGMILGMIACVLVACVIVFFIIMAVIGGGAAALSQPTGLPTP